MVELGHFEELDKIIQKVYEKEAKIHDRRELEQVMQNSEPTFFIMKGGKKVFLD